MRAFLLDEPELEFGAGTHVDIRFGLMESGPLDRGTDLAPCPLKVGVVGTKKTCAAACDWLQKLRGEIPAPETHLSNLHPPFPGINAASCFGTELQTHDRWISTVSMREIDSMISSCDPPELTARSVDLFLSHADDLVDAGGPHVLIIAPPPELFAALEADPRPPVDLDDQELDESTERTPPAATPCFHDLLKAKGMRLAVPIQMVRPRTYGMKVGKKKRRKGRKTLQDEPTRAWNFAVALYYKAGGTLWRIPRQASDLTACFVGVSFFRIPNSNDAASSVAHVFNERGEGIIVKGGAAVWDRSEHQYHLSHNDSFDLLSSALSLYRKEHHTAPARVVLHKTSPFSDAEQDGFKGASDGEKIDYIDLIHVRRSFSRFFRTKTYPPFRGTLVELEDSRGLLYLRGSVPFFQAYPGLYVPRPLEFCLCQSEGDVEETGAEMLALSKLNWNNTQFDGGEPITVRAARRVGDILKWIPSDATPRNGFRFFM